MNVSKLVPVLLCLLVLSLGCSSVRTGRDVIHWIELIDPIDESNTPREHQLVQLVNARGRVYAYRMDLRADVCLERICKMIDLTLFWDQEGRYKGMELPADYPLTKNDHEPFTRSDYRRMNKILKNTDSELGNYPLSTFVMSASETGVDAVSGATKKHVEDEIVCGAAYSSWVLWNWVNGAITYEIQRLTEEANPDA